MTRRDAYCELARRMGFSEAHIADMNEAQCARVVELFTAEPDRGR